MPQQATIPQQEYDPRWFIWTIVFLVVTGISLVSYIILSENPGQNVPDFSRPSRSVDSGMTVKQ